MEKRNTYGVSQKRLALMAGISREHLNRIEAGKVNLTNDMKLKLLEALEKFNPEAPLFLLFDYVRIRFPTITAFYPQKKNSLSMITSDSLSPRAVREKSMRCR